MSQHQQSDNVHISLTARPPLLRVWRALLVLAALPIAFLSALALRPGSALWWAITAVWVSGFVLCWLYYFPARLRGCSLTLGSEELVLCAGVFSHVRRRVPLGSIQYTKVYSSPLHKWCGLCTLAVFCAGGRAQMPGLTQEDAQRVLEEIFHS